MLSKKIISVELVVTRRAKGEEHRSKYEVYTRLSSEATVGDIADFVDGMKKIYAKAMDAAKNCETGSDVYMEIVESVYDDGGTQVSFDRWYLRDIGDISLEKGEESIYLVPDTRYTSENRDMSIGKNILRDMEFTMH